jgi:hypothetical protein
LAAIVRRIQFPRIGVIAMATTRPNHKDNPTDNTVQLSRSRAGVIVVVAGDVVIAAASLAAIINFAGNGSVATVVAILTSGFTAISTMTTAYFGIKTMSNTAQSFARQVPGTHANLSGEDGLPGSGQDGQAGDGTSGGPGDGTNGQPADGSGARQADDGSGQPAGDHEPHSAM